MFPFELRPYQVTGLFALLLYFIGAIWGSKQLDIQFHDTYFIIGIFQLCGLFGLVYILNSLGYWLTRHRALYSWPLYLHLISSTIFASIFVLYIIQYAITPGKLMETNTILQWNYKLMFLLLYLSFLFWLVGQLFFLFNIFMRKN